uniref:Uncharacterized protein n=1 Tax=Nicotiana tabacum TaxID=4097 RepID=A0A1S4ADV5_TOBAC|nr:PREDICTED: uncharacterized protein LOC107796538 [Nicotiana tabacum]
MGSSTPVAVHNFTTWKAQIAMLLHGHDLYGHLDGSTPSPPTTPTLNLPWDQLHTSFANKSQTRIFSLHHHLSRVPKDTKSIVEYLREIRSLSDELATAGSPVANEELVVKILSGLGPEFREISAAIRARDSATSYEELLDKLLDHEIFLKHEDLKKTTTQVIAAVAQRVTNSSPTSRNN